MQNVLNDKPFFLQGPLLLRWINFNPNTDKKSQQSMVEMTYPLPNLNNFIPRSIMDVLT